MAVNNIDISDDLIRASRVEMLPETTQRRNIYIDAELLYDFRLTALMSLVRTKEEYDLIVSRMDEYVNTPNTECCIYFPEIVRPDGLPYIDEDLDAILHDPANIKTLAAMAVPTRFLVELQTIITGINTENESKETNEPLSIVINHTYPMHKFLQDRIESIIKTVDPRVTVKFTNFKSWFEVPKDLLIKQDILCVYNTKQFLQEGTSSQTLLSDFKSLSNCMILALKSLDGSCENVDLGLRNLADIVGMMCMRFRFIDKSILRPEDLTEES